MESQLIPQDNLGQAFTSYSLQVQFPDEGPAEPKLPEPDPDPAPGGEDDDTADLVRPLKI